MSGAASPELSVPAALQALAAHVVRPTQAESIAVAAARQRILAEPVVAGFDIPGFDNAAMDGYALRHAEAGVPLTEFGRALAGHPFEGELQAGTCVRIMTGAALPAGADVVVMREDTRVEADRVIVERVPALGANIRRRGEHIANGATVLDAGRRLGSADLGMLAALGRTHVAVHARLRVGVLSTGDELADAPAPLGTGGSYDANRPLLAATLRALGFETHDLGICADRADAFDGVLQEAQRSSLDALVISGGAALGDADVVRRSGAVEFIPIAVRPGRGVAVATIGAERPCLVLGLPGNVVAAFVLFHLVARPLLLHRAGAALQETRHVPVRLGRDLQVRGGRTDYLRARWRDVPGLGAALEPLTEQSSSALHSVCNSDALLAAGPQAVYRCGDLVDAVLLDALD